MEGGGLHGNCRPAQDPCKELASGLSKGLLETQPKQEQETQLPELLCPAPALLLSLWRARDNPYPSYCLSALLLNWTEPPSQGEPCHLSGPQFLHSPVGGYNP